MTMTNKLHLSGFQPHLMSHNPSIKYKDMNKSINRRSDITRHLSELTIKGKILLLNFYTMTDTMF